MANAAALGQCQEVVEVVLKQKGTPLHDATVVAIRWGTL